MISYAFTKNDIADQIVEIALGKDMIVFGGYVRDKYILNIDKFNDIDIVYFNTESFDQIHLLLKLAGFIITIDKHDFSSYTRMSYNLSYLSRIYINGKNGVIFPDSMKFSIDLVKCHCSKELWLNTKDCDFSCNLFYLDSFGVHLRYNPLVKVYHDPQRKFVSSFDVFTYYKNLVLQKKFFIVTNLYKKVYQLKRLHYRATELTEKGWSMCGTFRSPFVTNFYNVIQIPNRTTCPICLDDFTDKTLITNTKCKHSYCNKCFLSSLVFNNNTVNCAFCRTKICERNNKEDSFEYSLSGEAHEYSLSGQRDEYSLSGEAHEYFLDRSASEDFIPVPPLITNSLGEVIALTQNLNILGPNGNESS